MKKNICALLVIDMQQVAFDGKITPPFPNASQLLDKITNLIEICRGEKIPIIYIQTCNPIPGEPYSKEAHGWEIHERIAPQDEDVVVFKENSSSFDGSDLHKVLSDLAVESLIMCGGWSEFCVASSVKDALSHSYQVCLAADGHSTVSDDEEKSRVIIARQNAVFAELGASVVEISNLHDHLIAQKLV